MPATNAAEVDPTTRKRSKYCALCVGSRKYAPVARTPTARYVCHACNGLLNITSVLVQNAYVHYRTPSLLAPFGGPATSSQERPAALRPRLAAGLPFPGRPPHYTHSM